MNFNIEKIKNSIKKSGEHPDCYVYLHNYVNVFSQKYPNQKGIVFYLRNLIKKKGETSNNFFYEQ